MTLLAFSIPEEIPYIIMAKVSTRATMCQPTFPKEDATLLNMPPRSSTPLASNRLPPAAENRYFNIHPTTTEYPMARAKLHSTGTSAKASPRLFPLPLISVAFPKAPIGPVPIARPKAISPTTPVKPMKATHIKYGIRKAAPPRADTLAGNSHIFPIPTAEPMHAIIKPLLLLKLSLSIFFSLQIISK